MSWIRAPRADETEISIFGPGVGECVVVHLGDGAWIVVDSCVSRTTKRAVALDYLAELGVDVREAVRLMVVSHWHDDHIRGASQILEAAASATLVCSAALKRNEFLRVLDASGAPHVEPSGVDEFKELFRVLRRRSGGRTASIGPSWTLENKCELRLPRARVDSLSPSAGTFQLALRELEALFPRVGAPKRRAVSQGPNRLSVVLWVESGENRLLLGGDLETGADERTGWLAILASSLRPAEKAHVFKVPHHGSDNADHPGVWTELLVGGPQALVAPYYAGRKPLPTDKDLRRISERTDDLFCAVSPKARRSRRPPAVQKMVRLAAPDLREIRRSMGQVRLRRSLDGCGDWSVELRGGAFRYAAA